MNFETKRNARSPKDDPSSSTRANSQVDNSGNSDVDVNVHVDVDTLPIAIAILSLSYGKGEISKQEYDRAVQQLEETVQKQQSKKRDGTSKVKFYDPPSQNSFWGR